MARLHKCGVEIVSTGSTAAAAIAESPGCLVTAVRGRHHSFPESLDGRVKTLHPAVHAGLLADLGRPEHEARLAELGIAPFGLLVSNLYPFEATVSSGAPATECVEQIDIGGPAMVRAAAKNHQHVAVLTDPAMYPAAAEAVAAGRVHPGAAAAVLAARAFCRTSAELRRRGGVQWFASSYAPDETAQETGWPDVTAAVWSAP